MSDTAIAQPQAAPASPQPSSTEVPINQTPTHTPNPLGPQTPSAPTKEVEGSKYRPESRAESLRKSINDAFDRANSPPPKTARPKADDKPAPKAAEAKAGHNQPPEPTEKIDLKKRPGDQPQEQPRDKGRFAPRKPEGNAEWNELAKPRTQQGQPDQPYKKLEPHEPYAEPPPRMAEHGKRDWVNTPETVRGEVHRMHSEFSKAAQHYQAVNQAFQPIAKYHQMAQQHGTTLERALNNYTSMEMKLRSDPIGGLDVIINNLDLKSPDGQKLGLRDIAYHVLSQSPEQQKLLQHGNQQQAANQQIGALHQEINGLKAHLQQMHTQQQFSYSRSAVDQFAADHPRFDELGTVIERELNLGFDLPTAYKRAELLFPATHAAQTGTPSAQTRPVDRSIHGNPDVAPSNGASRKPKEASRSPRDAVQNALNRFAGM